MSETVLEIVIRCPNSLTAEGLLAELRRLIEMDPEAHLDVYGIFDADAFDAPELPVEIEGVPA